MLFIDGRKEGRTYTKFSFGSTVEDLSTANNLLSKQMMPVTHVQGCYSLTVGKQRMTNHFNTYVALSCQECSVNTCGPCKDVNSYQKT
jgi:hypothetical protein